MVALFVIGPAIGGFVYFMGAGAQSIYFGMIDGVCSLAIGSAVSAVLVMQASKKAGILTLRRAAAVMLFSLFLMGVGLIAGSVSAYALHDMTVLERVYFVSCGLLMAFQFIILSVASDLKGVRLYFMSLVQPSIIFTLHLSDSRVICFKTNLLTAWQDSHQWCSSCDCKMVLPPDRK